MFKIIGALIGIGALTGGTYYLVQNTELPTETPTAIIQSQPAASTSPVTATPVVETATPADTQKPKPLPIVKTLQTKSIGSTVANLSGQITPISADATWWFEYGKDTSQEDKNDTPLGNTTVSRTVKASITRYTTTAYITKLEPFTKYSYRLVAKNKNGIVKGNILSFTTH